MGKSSTSLLRQLGVGIASLARELWCRRGWQCTWEGLSSPVPFARLLWFPAALGTGRGVAGSHLGGVSRWPSPAWFWPIFPLA